LYYQHQPKGQVKLIIAVYYFKTTTKQVLKRKQANQSKCVLFGFLGVQQGQSKNAILDTLKGLRKEDRIDVDDNIDDKLQEIYDDLLAEKLEIEDYNKYASIYEKYMTSRDFRNITDDELLLLFEKEFIDPKEDPTRPMDEDGNILYQPRAVFLVLDDLISTDAFSTKKNNFINKLCVKSRHDSDELCPINLFIISQNLKSIPPLIRRQSDIFVLLKNSNKEAIVDAISAEIGSHFTKEQVLKAYEYTSEIPYGALILDIHKATKDTHRAKLNWDNLLELD